MVSLVLDEGLTNPDIDKDVDQGEKAQDEDESLKKIVGVKYGKNPASRKKMYICCRKILAIHLPKLGH